MLMSLRTTSRNAHVGRSSSIVFNRIEVRPYSYAGMPNFSLCAVDLQYNHKDVFTVVNLASDLTVHVAGNPLVNLKLTGLLGQLRP